MAAQRSFMGASLGCITSQEGALGFFARFHSQLNVPYAVTCSHNLAPGYSSPAAVPTMGMPDQCSVFLPKSSQGLKDFIVGHRVWAKTLTVVPGVDYDCGIVRLSNSDAPDPQAAGIPINQVWINTPLPDNVLLVAPDRKMSGVVTQGRVSKQLTVPTREGKFTYSNLFAATYTPPNPDQDATQGGISGAPIVTADGFLVGMHVAGEGDVGYFQRADEILKNLGMELYQS